MHNLTVQIGSEATHGDVQGLTVVICDSVRRGTDSVVVQAFDGADETHHSEEKAMQMQL